MSFLDINYVVLPVIELVILISDSNDKYYV